MARRRRRARRRRTKRHDLGWIVGAGLLGYLILEPVYGTAVLVLLGFVLLMLWVLFVMPTKCDVEVDGRGCKHSVNGKLGACRWHDRDKRDAMFAALRMRNPGMIFRMLWTSGPMPGRPVGGSMPGPGAAGGPAVSRQAVYNLAMLTLTAVGSIAGVIALLL